MKVFLLILMSVAQGVHGESVFDLAPSKSLKILKSSQAAKVEELSGLSLEQQAEKIRKEVPVEILTSGRKGEHYFDFMGAPTKSLEEISNVEGLYGKVACPGVDQKFLIYLADDAPPTMLLHQYIHYLQIKSENRWCELQGRVLDTTEKNQLALLYHRFEFEDLKTLFDLQKKLTMNFEDRLIILEGLNRENNLFQTTGLDPQALNQLKKSLEVIHSQINYLKWLKRSPDDARSVIQKMEAFNLNACSEASKEKESPVKTINQCLEKRCSISGLRCEPISSDLKQESSLTLATQGWTGGRIDKCTVPQLRDEILDNLREPTPCWKTWSEYHSKNQPKNLQALSESQLRRNFKAPVLKIDSEISFQEMTNPELYIEKTYCYSIFDKVAGFGIIPVEQFAFASQGTIINYSKLPDYRTWLDSQEGKTCTKLVKLFSGQVPSPFEHIDKQKKYMFIINPMAALSGGLKNFNGAVVTDINHERLHLIFSENRDLRLKIKKEWDELSSTEQNDFKRKHDSYDFTDEDVLLREYFAFTRQDHPSG